MKKIIYCINMNDVIPLIIKLLEESDEKKKLLDVQIKKQKIQLEKLKSCFLDDLIWKCCDCDNIFNIMEHSLRFCSVDGCIYSMCEECYSIKYDDKYDICLCDRCFVDVENEIFSDNNK